MEKAGGRESKVHGEIRSNTRQKSCQSYGEATTRRGGKAPGGRRKTAGGGGEAGLREAGALTHDKRRGREKRRIEA